MEFHKCRYILETALLVLSICICTSPPSVARSVSISQSSSSKGEGSSSSGHNTILVHQSSRRQGKETHSNVTSLATSHQPISNTSGKQGSVIYQTKFHQSVDYKAQRHKAEETREIQPENLLKVKQVQEESNGHQVGKMVITIASALTVLFSMCMFSAIFLCCCRKKKKSTNEEDETDRKNLIDNKDSPPLKTKTKDPNEIDHSQKEKSVKDETDNSIQNKMEDKNKALQKTSAPDQDGDTTVSVQTKIKAFEVKTDSPSPIPGGDAMRHPKRRPESEAFKNFESKGILIGMGKAPKRKTELEPDISEDDDETPPEKMMTPIFVTEIANNKVLDKKKKKQIESCVVADKGDDDLGDFSVVKRETEILKSHRRAAPPTGRNRISKAMMRARKGKSDGSGLDITDNNGQDEKGEVESEKQDVIEQSVSETQISDSDSSSDSERTHGVKEKMETLGTKVILVEPISSDKGVDVTRGETVIETKHETKHESEQTHAVETNANIFFSIDPTAKSKSMGDITGITKNDKDHNDDSKRPTSGLKRSPNPNQEALLSALKRKLQSDENEDRSSSTDDVIEPESEYLEPVKRERTLSEPTSQAANDK